MSADDVPRCPGCSSPLCPDHGLVEDACTIEGCEKPRKARGWCSMHEARIRRHGDPHMVKRGPLRADWVNDAAISYRGMHSRVVRSRGKASEHPCSACTCPAEQWSYDETDPAPLVGVQNGSTVRWSADVERYRPMCRSCHKRADNGVRKAEGRWNPRTAIGTANPRAKLTADQVREIRRRAAETSSRLNVSALSREFGVCRGTIDRVLDGRAYRDVAA